ncbi:hypothetical protein ABZ725_42900 [Streptomyces sp. NPDC006872]|uniref:hypothetical protein n=1 Tax=Streptomyces sp. NPDC006872 TaxID=3155720 RepID=UPI0033F87F16
MDWAEQRDVPCECRLVDAIRGDIAAVDDVLEGPKALAGQLSVDVVEGIDVLLRRRAGDHLNGDGGARFVTGLGLVIAMPIQSRCPAAVTLWL